MEYSARNKPENSKQIQTQRNSERKPTTMNRKCDYNETYNENNTMRHRKQQEQEGKVYRKET